jgi:phosphonate transport system substrate-binding protein
MRRKSLHLFVPFIIAFILLVAFSWAAGPARAWLEEGANQPRGWGPGARGIKFGSSTEVVSQTVKMVFPIPAGSPNDVQFYRQAAGNLADLMTQETGLDVQMETVYCAGAAVDLLASGGADVGFLSSPTYVLAHDLYAVEVQLSTVRRGQSYYRSQFLVRSDSGINSLSDLAGKNFAFSDPTSASGYLYPATHISHTMGVDYETFFSQTLFTGSHFDVVRAVYHGVWDTTPIHGGATFEDARAALTDELPDVMDVVEVLTYTQNIPNDTVSTRNGLDPSLTDQVVTGLLNVAQTPAGASVLMDLLGAEGFDPVEDSTYDPVRMVVSAFNIELDTCGAIYLPVIAR